ncbi:MAG: methionine adenosyltransferase domain-containing protein [Patescibacteria group bacterium]
MKVVQACTEGHPDKVCDQIADAIVDEYLRRDSTSRVEISVMGSHGMLTIGGCVSSEADFDAGELARRVYHEIGYTDEIEPFVNIETHKSFHGHNGGAQSTTFVHGYATCETREMLPRSLVFANTIAQRLDEARKNDSRFAWIRPDGKVQLVMDGDCVKALTVLLQHDELVDHRSVQQNVLDHIITPVLGPLNGAFLSINPVGCFSEGGLGHDTGASNRKIGDDTYGNLIPFGSAKLSGLDPARPERAVAYMARYVAKWIVKREGVSNCLVRVATSLGRPEPVVLEAKTGDGRDVSTLIKAEFDFRVEAIVERLDLRKPIYRATSNYGQFGKSGLPWESLSGFTSV